MKLKMLTAAVATALLSTSAMAVDFNGYARSNVGASADGGMITSNKTLVGRLGNENDTYAEIAVGQNLYDDNGIKFSVHTLIAYSLGEDKSDWAGSQPAMREMYAKASGVLGNATLWAGKRYYQRHDIHIVDDYYWAINGEGAGIENIAIGDMSASIAWFQRGGASKNDDNGTIIDSNVNTNILDARLAGIDLGPVGSLEVGITSWLPNAESDAADASTMLTAELVQGGEWGFNKVIFQAANQGLANGFAYGTDGSWIKDPTEDAVAFRIYDWGVVSFSDTIQMGYTANFVSGSDLVDGSNSGDLTMYNVVVRPQYSWTDNMKSQLEVGYYAKDLFDNKSSEAKVTIAQTWAPGSNFWSRPEIRVFATYLTDLEDGTYVNGDDNALSVGVQMEAWW